MKPEILEQVKELLSDARTEEELAEITGIIEEAKGKIRLKEQDLGFWTGKTTCWEMFNCPVKEECPAFKHRAVPCWEIEGTYCKLSDYGAKGDGTEICESCRVYKKWGQADPIRIKLFGKGFNPVAVTVGGHPGESEVETKEEVVALKIGAAVKIIECAARPELVGAHGEIVQMQTQEYEQYSVRPIWVKMTSGSSEGKTCGFWENEVTILS